MSDLISKYNDHGALRMPKSLWLILGYGLRHIALILFPPTRVAFDNYTELFSNKLFLISDALILAVIILNTQRLPEASNFTRNLWRHALWLITGAFVIDALLTIGIYTKPLLDPDHLYFSIAAWSVLIDVGIVFYLLGVPSVRDVFASFPAKPPVEEDTAPTETPDSEPLTPINKPTRNIPDADLIKSPIFAGYPFADFPFHSSKFPEQILEIRQHLTNNNLELAEKGLRFLLESHPIDPMLWHELGLVAFSANKLPQAESLILKALLFDSSNYLYWRNLGEIRRRMGNLDGAISSANQAIKLMPSDVNAHYNLGLALWDAGRNDEALFAFSAAKKLHPDVVSHTSN
jgi:hypothetical protein